jgi:hypothetical protein
LTFQEGCNILPQKSKMKSLENAARWEFIVLLVGFAAVTAGKLFQTASFQGLLRTSNGSLSAGRVQLLVFTVMTAMQYLLATLHDPSHMPAIPSWLVAGLGASQAVYLGAKAWAVFRVTGKKTEEK